MSGSDFNNIGMQKSPPPPVMHLSFGPEMYAPVAGNGDGSIGVGEAAKKKRGRPRKYGPEGPIPVPLSSAPPSHVNISQPSGTGSFSSPSPPQQQQQTPPHAPSQEQTPPHAPSQQQMLPHAQSQPLQEQPQDGAQAGSMRKARGRPPGSKNKHKQESIGALGIGFTPHVITVNTGEDVASRILSFSQTGPRAVCILSANGAISNVTLRQASTSGGSVTYEGRFEILSLSGSFMLSDSGGQRGRSGGLSVSLAGPDGRVLGGGVAGLLIAASPVQVVVGSFIAEGQRDNRVGNLTEPLFSPPKSYAGSGPTGPSSPPSRGTLSESSGGGGSPLNHSTGVVNSTPVGMSNLSWK